MAMAGRRGDRLTVPLFASHFALRVIEMFFFSRDWP
jgi:hypothetical protein